MISLELQFFLRSCIAALVFIINLIFGIFQYIQPFNFPATHLLCLWKSNNSSNTLTIFVTWLLAILNNYYANIIGSGLVFEAGGVMGTTPQKYIPYCLELRPGHLSFPTIFNQATKWDRRLFLEVTSAVYISLMLAMNSNGSWWHVKHYTMYFNML